MKDKIKVRLYTPHPKDNRCELYLGWVECTKQELIKQLKGYKYKIDYNDDNTQTWFITK